MTVSCVVCEFSYSTPTDSELRCSVPISPAFVGNTINPGRCKYTCLSVMENIDQEYRCKELASQCRFFEPGIQLNQKDN